MRVQGLGFEVNTATKAERTRRETNKQRTYYKINNIYDSNINTKTAETINKNTKCSEVYQKGDKEVAAPGQLAAAVAFAAQFVASAAAAACWLAGAVAQLTAAPSWRAAAIIWLARQLAKRQQASQLASQLAVFLTLHI